MSFLSFLTQYKFVIMFYLAIILLIYFNRKKFEVQAKIIYLYKTKFGLKFMDSFANPRSEKTDGFGRFLFGISAGLTIISGLVMLTNKMYDLFVKSNLLSEGAMLVFFMIFSASFIFLLISIIFFKQLKSAGTVGIYVGFLGMILISVFVLKGFVDLFLKPDAPPVLSPIIPGVSIPGSPIMVPFWYGIIALFVVVLIHEFSHGILCRVHKIKVKSSGVGMMAILPLAFVEPDEESLKKSSFKAKNSMFAAGPFSNILTGILVILILTFILLPVTFSMAEPIEGGVRVFALEGTPASQAGIGTRGSIIIPVDVLNKYPVSAKDSEFLEENSGKTITSLNGVPINSTKDFITQLENVTAGDTVILANDKESFAINTINKSGKPYMGVNIVGLKIKEASNNYLFNFFKILLELFIWIYTLSLGLGLANLLPLGITDGGRMIHITLEKWFGEKKAIQIFSRVTVLFFVIILVLVFVPIIKAVI
ncbi:MAG: site-2 protease family protein [Nanoarchaeota archaeon]|nr:site-2 protease family protein [Nanoarchaeota archaeon]MBU1269575.1 site-2 protease family protein [Nanoarchaeota archaeon]MBU1604693.1 site-2 protease family protein [Nanoarchaeota archaeon]MBU2443836.1 site-2 protease family protein [Nanoarchaeota archaeon]